MKTDQPWSAIARPSVWSGHRSVPQIVASIGEEHAGQIVSPLDVLSRVRGAKREESVMENIFLCCAGLDIHKESVEACVRRMEPGGRLHRQTRHWATMSRDILLMADWMAAQGGTHVAMESTGVFWKPIFNILEGRFQVLLVNARHLKQVPGRKSDIQRLPVDCTTAAMWAAEGQLYSTPPPARVARSHSSPRPTGRRKNSHQQS